MMGVGLFCTWVFLHFLRAEGCGTGCIQTHFFSFFHLPPPPLSCWGLFPTIWTNHQLSSTAAGLVWTAGETIQPSDRDRCSQLAGSPPPYPCAQVSGVRQLAWYNRLGAFLSRAPLACCWSARLCCIRKIVMNRNGPFLYEALYWSPNIQGVCHQIPCFVSVETAFCNS